MPIFDKLANAAKDFFIEPEQGAPAPPAAPPTVPYGATAQPAATPIVPDAAPNASAAPGQAEQRHVARVREDVAYVVDQVP